MNLFSYFPIYILLSLLFQKSKSSIKSHGEIDLSRCQCDCDCKIISECICDCDCLNKDQNKCSSELYDSDLNEEMIKYIVEVHNEIRMEVANGGLVGQPEASNMRELVWSEEIAKKTKEFVSNCPDDYNSNFPIGNMNFIGENMYFSWSENDKFNLDRPLLKWKEEYKYFDTTNIPAFGGSVDSKSYVNLIWGNADHIGCAYSQYDDVLNGKTLSKVIFVCDYFTSEKDPLNKVYIPGVACENCKDCSTNYPGLCKNEEASDLSKPQVEDGQKEDFKKLQIKLEKVNFVSKYEKLSQKVLPHSKITKNKKINLSGNHSIQEFNSQSKIRNPKNYTIIAKSKILLEVYKIPIKEIIKAKINYKK